MNNITKYVIVDLVDETKCEGYLVSVDKEKLEIVLSLVKRYKLKNDQKINEELFETLSIPKSSIIEVKMISEGQPQPQTQTQSQSQTQSQPQIQVSSQENDNSTNINPNAIPKHIEKQVKPKKYEKGNFFDSISSNTNLDNLAETIKYNAKNQETFNLSESEYKSYSYNSNNNSNYRGRGNNNNYRGNNSGCKIFD